MPLRPTTQDRDQGQPPERGVVFICQGPSCSERGGEALLRQGRLTMAPSGPDRSFQLCGCTCLDSCATGPNVLVTSESGLQTGVLSVDQLMQVVAPVLPEVLPEDGSRSEGPGEENSSSFEAAP